MSKPKPELNLHFTPEQLRGNATFQEAFVVTKPHLQNMLLHLQRMKSVEYKEDKEELGRQILIIHDIFTLLNECTASEFQAGAKQKRPKLHNRP